MNTVYTIALLPLIAIHVAVIVLVVKAILKFLGKKEKGNERPISVFLWISAFLSIKNVTVYPFIE